MSPVGYFRRRFGYVAPIYNTGNYNHNRKIEKTTATKNKFEIGDFVKYVDKICNKTYVGYIVQIFAKLKQNDIPLYQIKVEGEKYNKTAFERELTLISTKCRSGEHSWGEDNCGNFMFGHSLYTRCLELKTGKSTLFVYQTQDIPRVINKHDVVFICTNDLKKEVNIHIKDICYFDEFGQWLIDFEYYDYKEKCNYKYSNYTQEDLIEFIEKIDSGRKL